MSGLVTEEWPHAQNLQPQWTADDGVRDYHPRFPPCRRTEDAGCDQVSCVRYAEPNEAEGIQKERLYACEAC